MNTIEQTVAPDQESRRRAAGRLRPCADARDVLLLFAVMLTLLCTAAGIALAFPAALENASLLASVSSAAPARDHHVQPDEAEEEEGKPEGKPFVTDDVRPEGLMQAAAAPHRDF